MVKEYYRPESLDEALRLLAAPGAVALSGGTWLLAFEARDKPERVVDVARVVPRGLSYPAGEPVGQAPRALSIGAGTTFQELIESDAAPRVLKDAALTMGNRNTRNRATVGGNLGAGRSCASLAPALLALGASLEYREPGSRTPASASVADWLERPRGIILGVTVPLAPGLRAAALRASRTACDIATCTASCAYRLEGGIVRDLRLALGGFGPRPAARPDIAALFEGKPLPPKADIERAVLPLLAARSDARGGADYKRLRGAALAADALHAAAPLLPEERR